MKFELALVIPSIFDDSVDGKYTTVQLVIYDPSCVSNQAGNDLGSVFTQVVGQ